MKDLLTTLILCLLPSIGHAQSYDQNFVKEVEHFDTLWADITKVNYYNGLGYLVETATTGFAGFNNIYTLTDYDSKGRESKIYRPTPIYTNLSYYEPQIFKDASKKYYGNEFSSRQNHYDYADRIVREYIEGFWWFVHSAHNEYSFDTNTADDKVIRYSETLGKGYYPAGCLEKETAMDADGHAVVSFKNLDGNVVLERRNQGDTYFVYDRLGQLTYILSPKYQEDADLAAYAYQYVYDKRGNLVKKTLPGTQYAQYWYDKEDHLVFEQDAHLRSKGLYRFYLYDELGRVAVVGTSRNCQTSVQDLEAKVIYTSADGILHTGYMLPYKFPDIINAAEATIEKVNFYDNYDFLTGSHRGDFSDIKPVQTTGANGLLAGSITKATNGQYLFEVKCYDPKGNVTNTLRKGLDGYASNTVNVYTLTNKLDSTRTEVSVGYGENLKISIDNEYSRSTNLPITKTITLEHGYSPYSSTMRYSYDELNRLAKVFRPYNVGNVVYEYDVHGWPTKIETNSFKEYLYYTDGEKPCYNGDISVMKWSNNNYGSTRGYIFTYDGLNRLTNAVYCEGDNLKLDRAYGRFTESIRYDLNGNITHVERGGHSGDGGYTTIDNLDIRLSGNQMASVTETASPVIYEGALDFNAGSNGQADYKYNGFGALTSDTGRGITMIEYDDSKNPARIQFANGNVTKYVYSSDGQKLRTIYYTAMPNIKVGYGETHELTKAETQVVDSVDYLLDGNLILKNGRIKSFLFEGGYCDANEPFVCLVKPALFDEDLENDSIDWENMPETKEVISFQDLMDDWQASMDAIHNSDDFTFYYFNKDHLGNNREVVDDSGNICQVINYYPYGMPYSDPKATIKADLQPFKYNGKEFDMMHGLDTYDYGARQYNPIVPTWDRIDNRCEDQPYCTPYMYGNGNPVNSIDKDGNVAQWIIGAVVGGGVDYGAQVLANLISKKSIYDSFYGEVDFADVGASAAEGALTCGESAIKKGLVMAGTMVARNTVDIKGNDGLFIEKSPTKFAKNMTTDVATLGIGHYATKGVKKVVGHFAPKPYTPQKVNNVSKKTKQNQKKREKERKKKIDTFYEKVDKYVTNIITSVVNVGNNLIKNLFGN